MSDLLNSASLVMIPSGYKEDTVFSAIPTDGSGDLSFTRASNGTRVNSAGLVEVCPWNLLEQSETFDTASWPKLECSITANSTNSPIGTLTADSLIESNTNSRHMIYRAFTSVVGQSYSLSVYCKQSTRRYANINLKTSSTASPRFSALFDLQTGLNVSTSAVGSPTGTSFDIVSFPNGWYRISISMNATSTSTEYEISTSNSTTPSLAEGTPAYLGDGTSGIYIWGAQLNIGSTAKPYFPTTDRLNVPRLTYQNGGGGCPSLLLEKQSTNLFTYSEQLQTGTGGTLTVTPNTAISPDGTQNADSLGAGYLTKSISATAGTWTFSTFAKYLSANTFQLYIYDGAYYDATFNVSTGVVASSSAGVTASIQNMGNGWYRCIMTATTANNVSEIGFGSGNVYAWGCQMESGSYATSYIPTTSSSATRVADACSKTGISSLIGQTEGTLFIDMVPTDVSGQGRFMNIYNGANSSNGWNAIISSGSTPNTFRFYGDGFDFSGGACLFGVRVKAALAYKNGVLTSAYVNGASVGTLTAVTTGKSYDKLELGSGPFGLDGSCNVNQSIIFPTALTNAELASLTTI